MAFTTTNLIVKASDGWVLVATNPINLILRPDSSRVYNIAVTSGAAPTDNNVSGLLMGEEETKDRPAFSINSAITGNVYVRIPVNVGHSVRFGIVLNT